MRGGWIGVDLDGTLACFAGEHRDLTKIGPPVTPVLMEVLSLIRRGYEVRIFTARANDPVMKAQVEEWCLKHVGVALQVTATKDFGMIELWDDRAVHIKANMGVPCCGNASQIFGVRRDG